MKLYGHAAPAGAYTQSIEHTLEQNINISIYPESEITRARRVRGNRINLKINIIECALKWVRAAGFVCRLSPPLPMSFALPFAISSVEHTKHSHIKSHNEKWWQNTTTTRQKNSDHENDVHILLLFLCIQSFYNSACVHGRRSSTNMMLAQA